MTVLRWDQLAISPWPNGAGRKADIAAGPGWLMAFAFLDQDAPFSDYSGHDRTITLLDGPGFTLSGPGRSPEIVNTIAQPAAFDGGWRAQCTVAGPSIVVNAMTERTSWRHQVTLCTSGLIDPGTAEAAALVVLAGTLTAAQHTLGPRDVVLVRNPTAATVTGLALLLQVFSQ